MTSPVADDPDTETAAEESSSQALTATARHSIEPDRTSSVFVDAPEERPGDRDMLPADSEKAASIPSKRSKSSPVSITSTVEYSQTPFEQYTQQVKELCHLLWPSSPKVSQDVKVSRVERLLTKNRVAEILLPKKSRTARAPTQPKEFVIHRLRGGGSNRVIGITIISSSDAEPVQLVLRVPRFENTRHDREVAVLHFIRHFTTIPVPEVKYVDITSDNPLKRCYVINNRILGYDLQYRTNPTFYPDLSHEQKCSFAKDFALILLKLHGIMHPFPGLLQASADSDNHRVFTVRHFDLKSVSGYEPEQDLNTKLPFFQPHPFVRDWVPPEPTPFKQTTYYFMSAQFGRWKALELRTDPATVRWSNHYDRLVTMANQMDRLGFLGNNENCLCHLDLSSSPRNIMADIRPDGSLSITGILDWDSAVFAPRFVGCAPPMWLWAWGDEDEKHANDVPSDPKDQEIKRIFEDTVGGKFLSYAYKPEHGLARELFRFAQSGIRTSAEFDEVEDLLKEWTELYEARMADKEKQATDTEVAAVGTDA